MRAGKLDRVIRIDRYSTSGIDGYGSPAPAWEALATLRAQMLQSGTEEFIRNGAIDETIVIFRTRYLDGVTTADRVHHAGRYYNIKEIKEIGRRNGLELRAIATGEP